MPTNKTKAELSIWEPRARKIADASSLFEVGEPSAASSDLGFILRLNTLLARREIDVENKVPKDLALAISTTGQLRKYAELIVFGTWLLLDGHPGMPKRRGRKPNLHLILKCVAAAIMELRLRPALEKHNLRVIRRRRRKNKITSKELAERWNELFKDEEKHTAFDARLRSMRHMLPAYLEHLQSGKAIHAGKTIKTSPEIETVLKAISGDTALSTAKTIPAPMTSKAATLLPFEIELCYSTAALEQEYRNRPAGFARPSQLQYLPQPISSTVESGNIRSDRKGKIALAPNVSIRRDYTARALIDRIVVVVDITIPTSARSLHDKILQSTGANTFVCDLKTDRDGYEWGTPLPKADPRMMTGQSFAIMIQDPTPDLVTNILNLIRHSHGIEGSVGIHLIEVSVDFYPHKNITPEKSILLREQMVGLLQRHHWIAPKVLLRQEPDRPRVVDARQFYGKATRPRYLFAQAESDKIRSDAEVNQAEVSKRILTAKPGNDLYLNATVWKGAKDLEFLISIQHKIADRRNKAEQTKQVLPDDQRRARIEVTISGSSTLKERGLATIDDLSTLSFRSLCKDTLSFKLGTIEPKQHLFEDAQIQMRTRGVYGMELRHRAHAHQERNNLRKSGRKLPRKTERENLNLEDWSEMNEVVRHALDALSRRWRDFSFR